jgi:hypothetical protein
MFSMVRGLVLVFSSELNRHAGAAAAVLLFLVVSVVLMPNGFWVIDEAGRYLQTVSLSRSIELPPGIDYPGAFLLGDSAGEMRPLPYHYGYMREGRLFSQYSPLMALLTMPLFLLAGRPGMFFLPVVGAAVLWIMLSKAARRRGFSEWSSILLPAACTPLLFYGSTIWSHNAAIALGLGAWIASGNGRTGCSLLLALGASLLRVEMLLLFPFLLMRGGKNDLTRRLLLSVLCMAVFLAASRLLTGEWIGSHLLASGSEQVLYGHTSMSLISAKLFVFSRSLLFVLPGVSTGLNVAVGTTLWLLWILSWRSGKFGRTAFFLGLAICVAAIWSAVSRDFRLLDLFSLKHPLLVFPVLWLVRPCEWKIPSVMLLILLLAAGPMHVEDLAWGIRLLMLPFFMLALFAEPIRGRILGVLLTGSFCVILALGSLWTKRQRSEELVDLTKATGHAVICTSWLLPGEFAELQAEGVPVVLADRSGEFLLALDLMSGLDPVVVCLERDIANTITVLSGAGLDPEVKGVIGFDPSFGVAVVSPQAH